MSRIPLEDVEELKKEGKTFEEIGDKYGVSRQRIFAIFSGYAIRYQKSDKYKMYKRHQMGHIDPRKPCTHCSLDKSFSLV